MAVVRVDPLKVTSEIPEKMVPWISVGQTVELHVDAYPDKAIAGKMSRISPAVNSATRAFPFEALVPNSDALLKPGTFARVKVQTNKVGSGADAAVLRAAVPLRRQPRVRRQRRPARRQGTPVGERLGDRIEIVSGVNAGDPVAMTDVDKLVDGLKVSVGAEGGIAMLSELCVRRPGLRDDARHVARRDRDLLLQKPRRRSLPPSRSGDGQRLACRCPAPARTRSPRRSSSRWKRRSAASPASTKSPRASAKAAATSPFASFSNAI